MMPYGRTDAEGVVRQFMDALRTGRMQGMKDAAAAAVELGLQSGSSGTCSSAEFNENVASLVNSKVGRPSQEARPGARYGGL